MDKLIKFLKSRKNFEFDLPVKKFYTANDIEAFQKKYPDYPIKELLTQIKLREKVKDKVKNYHQMIFTAKGAEQATVWQIAKYHAEKLKNYTIIADLCCGIGSDLIYLAKNKKTVYAVDSDETTLEYAKFNAKGNIKFLSISAQNFNKPVDAIYIDPDRRYSGKRELQPENYSPSLKEIFKLFNITKNIMIKLSPAINYKKIKIPYKHTFEFISCCGELKEILLCFGDLASETKKKVVIADKNIFFTPVKYTKTEEKGLLNFIIEPNPAIIKAEMTTDLAIYTNSYPLMYANAILTSEQLILTEFGNTYKVITKDKLKNLKKYLKKRDAKTVIFKTRRFPIEVKEFRKKFKLKGKNTLIIYILPKKDNFIFAEVQKL